MRRKYVAVNRLTGNATRYRFWTLRGASRWLDRDWQIAGIQMGRRVDMFDIYEVSR